MDVRLPDGTLIKNVPDNMSKADLVIKLKANGHDVSGLESAQQTEQKTQAPKKPFDTELNFAEKLAQHLPSSWADNGGGKIAGFVQGAADPSVGIAQGALNIAGGIGNAIGIKNNLSDSVNHAIHDQNSQYETARQQEGRGGFDAMRLAGNVASPVNVLGAKFMPAAPTSATSAMKQGSILGAAYGAENPVNDIKNNESYAGNKTEQVAIGAGSGAVASPAMYGLARTLAPKVSAEWQELKDAGVNTSIGQRLGGILGSAEEKMTSWMPSAIAEPIANARGRAVEDFNTATYNKALTPIGEKVSSVGHDAAKETAKKLGDAIQKGESMLGGFKLDQTATTSMANLENGVNNATNLTPKGKADFTKMLDLVKQNISPNGSILAEGYNELNSKLSKEIAAYKGATDVYQRGVGDALEQLQATIKDNALRANPNAAELINKAKAGYAMYIRAEGAAKSAASNNNAGVFTPKQLMQAVRSADTSVRDRATAHGDALLQDWAQTGMKVLGDKIPNSGTVNRGSDLAAVATLASNPHLIIPAITGTVASHVGYTPTGQKVLNKLVTDRPEIALKLAELLRKSAPYAGIPATAPLLNSGN